MGLGSEFRVAVARQGTLGTELLHPSGERAEGGETLIPLLETDFFDIWTVYFLRRHRVSPKSGGEKGAEGEAGVHFEEVQLVHFVPHNVLSG